MPDDTVRIVWDNTEVVAGLMQMHSGVKGVGDAIEKLQSQTFTFAAKFSEAIAKTRAEMASLIADIKAAEDAMIDLAKWRNNNGEASQYQSRTGPKPYGFYPPNQTYPPPYTPAQGPGGAEYGLGGFNQGIAMLQGIQPMNMVGGHGDPQAAARRAAALQGAQQDAAAAESIAAEEKKALGFANRAAVDAAAAAAKLAEVAKGIGVAPGARGNAESREAAYGWGPQDDAYNQRAKALMLQQRYLPNTTSAQSIYDSGPTYTPAQQREQGLNDLMAQYRMTPQDLADIEARKEKERTAAALLAKDEYERWRLQQVENQRVQVLREKASADLERNASRYVWQDQQRLASKDPVSSVDLLTPEGRAALGTTEYDAMRGEFGVQNAQAAAKADLERNMARYQAQDFARQVNQVNQVDLLAPGADRSVFGQSPVDILRAQLMANPAGPQMLNLGSLPMGGPAMMYGLNKNIGVAQQQQAAAFQALGQAQASGTGVPAATAAYQQASAAVQQLVTQQQALVQGTNQVANAQNNAANGTRNFADQLRTQVSYAVGAILIYGGMRKAAEEFNMALQGGMQIQRTQIESQFISGQSAGQTNAQFLAAAQYGIGPSAAAPGLIAAATTGATAQEQEIARQATLMYGPDQFVNILQEIQQTKRRAASVGQKFDPKTMANFLASAYQMGQSLENGADAYQLGYELQSTLGASPEQSGLGILQISRATEQSPQIISNIIERVRLALEGTGSKQHLRALNAMGITAADTPGYFREISSAVSSATSAGDTGRADKILQSLVGGLAGPQTLVQLRQVFTELNTSLNGAQQPLADFTKLIDGLNSSAQKATAEFGATWELFLSNMAAAFISSPFGQYLQGQLSSASTGLQAVVETRDAQKYFASLPYDEQQALVARFAAANPNEPAGKLANGQLFPKDLINILRGNETEGLSSFTRNDFVGETMRLTTAGGSAQMNEGDTLKLLQWIAAHMNDSANAADSARWNGIASTYATGPTSTSRLNSRPSLPTYDFGGFQTLEKGMDWNKLTADIKKYEAQLAKEVPGYEQNPQEVAFWDESKKYFRTTVGDQQAIRMAVEEQRDLMKQVTGLFNVPTSGEVLIPFAALEAGYGPNYGGSGSGGGTTGSGTRSGNTSVKGGGNKSPLRKRTQGVDDDLGLMDELNGSGANYRAKARKAANGHWVQDPDADVGLMDPSHDPNRTSDGRRINEMHDMYKNANGLLQQLAVAVQITLNNRVTISGKTIVDTQTQEMANALGSVRRGGGGAGAQALVS